MASTLVGVDETLKILGVSRTTLQNRMNAGTFPRGLNRKGKLFWEKATVERYAKKKGTTR